MTIEKNTYGAWTVSDVVDGYLIRRTYYMHTKREAVRAFRAEMKGGK